MEILDDNVRIFVVKAFSLTTKARLFWRLLLLLLSTKRGPVSCESHFTIAAPTFTCFISQHNFKDFCINCNTQKSFSFFFSLFFPYTKSSHFLIKQRAITAHWNQGILHSCLIVWQSWFLALKNSTYDNFLKLSKKSIFTIEKKLSHAKSFEVWLFLLSWQLSLLSAFQ